MDIVFCFLSGKENQYIRIRKFKRELATDEMSVTTGHQYFNITGHQYFNITEILRQLEPRGFFFPKPNYAKALKIFNDTIQYVDPTFNISHIVELARRGMKAQAQELFYKTVRFHKLRLNDVNDLDILRLVNLRPEADMLLERIIEKNNLNLEKESTLKFLFDLSKIDRNKAVNLLKEIIAGMVAGMGGSQQHIEDIDDGFFRQAYDYIKFRIKVILQNIDDERLRKAKKQLQMLQLQQEIQNLQQHQQHQQHQQQKILSCENEG